MLPMTSENWQLISTCVHEAAHSVIAFKLGIGTASIRVGEEYTTGRTNFKTETQDLYSRLWATGEPDSELCEFAHKAGVIAAAGYIAEARQRGIDFKQIRHPCDAPGYTDLRSMKKLCAKLNVDESSTIEKWDFEAIQLVEDNWLLIEELAKALMESPVHAFNGDEIHQIISSQDSVAEDA
jgi:hypothetical protein